MALFSRGRGRALFVFDYFPIYATVIVQYPKRKDGLMLIAERLDWLFRNIRKPDDSEYSLAEVEQGIKEMGGGVSTSTLHKIRHGAIRNPGYLTLKAIAAFFGVPITFFDSDESDAAQSLVAVDDVQLQQIAWRAAELDTESKNFLLEMIVRLKQFKQSRP